MESLLAQVAELTEKLPWVVNLQAIVSSILLTGIGAILMLS